MLDFWKDGKLTSFGESAGVANEQPILRSNKAPMRSETTTALYNVGAAESQLAGLEERSEKLAVLGHGLKLADSKDMRCQ